MDVERKKAAVSEPEIRIGTRPRRRRQPEKVRAQVLKAALQIFSKHGFDGATVRAIAELAKVEPTLLLYHFKTKEQLWHAVMAQVLSAYSLDIGNEFAKMRKVPASEVLRGLIERMVRHYATVPELHRIMIELGQQDNDRLHWVVDHFVKPQFDRWCNVIKAAQDEGCVRAGAPDRLRYAIVGMAAVPFSTPSEHELLVGRPFHREQEIEATTAMIIDMIFIKDPEGVPPPRTRAR